MHNGSVILGKLFNLHFHFFKAFSPSQGAYKDYN